MQVNSEVRMNAADRKRHVGPALAAGPWDDDYLAIHGLPASGSPT